MMGVGIGIAGGMVKEDAIFKRIKQVLAADTPGKEAVKLHLLALKYADALGDISGKEFCKRAGLPEVWGAEYYKMRNLLPQLQAAGLDATRLNPLDPSSGAALQATAEDTAQSLVADIDTLGALSLDPAQVPALEGALGKLRGLVEEAAVAEEFQQAPPDPLLDRMPARRFSKLKVVEYRRLRNLEVNRLATVNLFAGANNSGKTSFLEATYLLCQQNDFAGLVDLQRRRGKIADARPPSRWLAEELAGAAVEGLVGGTPCSVAITPLVEENGDFDRTGYLRSVQLAASFGELRSETLARIRQGRDYETLGDAAKPLAPAVFSSPFFLNEPHHHTRHYRRAVRAKLLQRALDFIRKLVVPTVQDVRLVDEFQRFLVDDAAFASQAMDLTSYGEGLQRIFFTSLLFASARNGVVLIDEFENAIHTDLLARFSPFVHSLAQEFNVQVFLTSHSKECIDSFVAEMPESGMDDFSFHAFVHDGDQGVAAREFDGKEFHKLLAAGDVDLRRAR